MIKQYFLLILLFLSLISCGFRPIYKVDNQIFDQGQSYKQELASIKIEIAQKKLNQYLKNNLEKILNPDDIKTEAKYLLSLTLKKSIASTFINFTGSSGRNKVILVSYYKLKDLNSGDIISSGSTTAQDNFDVEDKRFANYIAENSIATNLTTIIAKNIRDLLINDFLSKQPKPLTFNYKSQDNFNIVYPLVFRKSLLINHWFDAWNV